MPCNEPTTQTQQSVGEILSPENQAVLVELFSKAEEINSLRKELFKPKEQSDKPSSTAKGFLPEVLRKGARIMISIAKFVLALAPHKRQYDLGLDLLKVPLTKAPGKEWIVEGVSALKDFLKTFPSKAIQGIGAIFGFILAMTTTKPGRKWFKEGADVAAFIATFLPQTNRLVQFISAGKKILTSMGDKEGVHMILSIASAALGLFPQTRFIGLAVDIVRTIIYELPGKGYIGGALCLGKCVVKNVVPFLFTGVKWIGSWFG